MRPIEKGLNLGCFNQPVDGWYNTDITPHIWLSRVRGAPLLFRSVGLISAERLREHRAGIYRKVHYLDITKRFPFAAESFEGVFCSHILEHIHRTFVPHVFSEVLRVLQPSGIFRVVVPSLELAIRSYQPASPDDCLNLIFENDHRLSKNIHKWMYTEESLAKIFLDAGFTAVTPQPYQSGRLPNIKTIDNRPENSIYVEGVKPSPERPV
jgi:predicted SAM-dependent methyltransferase